MLEARCLKCHETFVPTGETPEELEHGQTMMGQPCGGQGVVVAEYFPPSQTN